MNPKLPLGRLDARTVLPILAFLLLSALLPFLLVIPALFAAIAGAGTAGLWAGVLLSGAGLVYCAFLYRTTLRWARARSERPAEGRQPAPAAEAVSAQVPLREGPAAPIPAAQPLPETPATAGLPGIPAAPAMPPPSPGSCVIDGGLRRRLSERFGSRGAVEEGGFMLGWRDARGTTHLTVAVFPRQTKATPVHCEFPVDDLEIAREACQSIENEAGAERVSLIAAWIHTHPRLGVFLSGTDKATLARWNGLDRNVLAVVVDEFANDPGKRLGVFRAGSQPVRWTTASLGLGARLRQRFEEALLAAYAARKLPPAELLYAGDEPAQERAAA